MLTRVTTVAIAAVLGLGGCGDSKDKINIGAKNFGESRILAEMMAALAEKQGVPVAGIVDYPTTQVILEALKRGDIDAYPDYNGTGLVMLGQNPTSDGDEAMARVKEIYEPLGLSWLKRFGFANNYGLAVRQEQADELGLASISELVIHAPRLTIAIEDDFEKRPLDGFAPMTTRYGMEFGNVDVVALDDRGTIYDRLIDGDVDVIEVYTTDGQIADYGLVVLEDDAEFFPVYEAAPLVRADALAMHAGLGVALDTLAGKIDADVMRELNGRVEIEGHSPRAVARDALARLGLIDSGAVVTEDPLLIATEPPFTGGTVEATALRAARQAFQGRNVQILPQAAPLEDVASGRARLALVSADAFFDVTTPAPIQIPGYEAVAAAGEALVHIVAARDGIETLADAKTIAVGPAGSSSERIATVLISGLGLGASPLAVDAGTADALMEAVESGSADAAVVLAVEGDDAIDQGFMRGGLQLMSPEGWKEGANLVRFPFLREARLSGNTYRGQLNPVETLRTQLVLAGPAPNTSDMVGDQGPSSISVSLSPISNDAVETLNGSIPGEVLVDPVLPLAAALSPVLPEAPAAVNPSPDISILSLVIVIGLVWIFWLYARPKYR